LLYFDQNKLHIPLARSHTRNFNYVDQTLRYSPNTNHFNRQMAIPMWIHPSCKLCAWLPRPKATFSKYNMLWQYYGW